MVLNPIFREENDPEKLAIEEATLDFVALITAPEAPRLSRCRRCQKFYLAARRGAKLFYCPDGCGNKTTAAESMRKKRHRTRAKKIELIEKVLHKARIREGHEGQADERFLLTASTLAAAVHHLTFTDDAVTKHFLAHLMKARVFDGELARRLKALHTSWRR